MYVLTVENDKKEQLRITGNPDYTLYRIDGLNPPVATINSSINSAMDGVKINSVKLGSRNIVLYITINNNIELNRINLYRYFPIKSTIKLYFKNDTRKVYIDGVVESFECDLFSNRQFAQISILCHNPYFKDIESFTNILSNISSLFSFPFSIENPGIEFSELSIKKRISINNMGDDTGLFIEIFANGIVRNPVIYDVLKRKHLKLNIVLQNGDKVTINTNLGNKSITLIRAGTSSNAMGHISPDSSWINLSPGENVFTHSADEGKANLQIMFKSRTLYSGV